MRWTTIVVGVVVFAAAGLAFWSRGGGRTQGDWVAHEVAAGSLDLDGPDVSRGDGWVVLISRAPRSTRGVTDRGTEVLLAVELDQIPAVGSPVDLVDATVVYVERRQGVTYRSERARGELVLLDGRQLRLIATFDTPTVGTGSRDISVSAALAPYPGLN